MIWWPISFEETVKEIKIYFLEKVWWAMHKFDQLGAVENSRDWGQAHFKPNRKLEMVSSLPWYFWSIRDQ